MTNQNDHARFANMLRKGNLSDGCVRGVLDAIHGPIEPRDGWVFATATDEVSLSPPGQRLELTCEPEYIARIARLKAASGGRPNGFTTAEYADAYREVTGSDGLRYDRGDGGIMCDIATIREHMKSAGYEECEGSLWLKVPKLDASPSIVARTPSPAGIRDGLDPERPSGEEPIEAATERLGRWGVDWICFPLDWDAGLYRAYTLPDGKHRNPAWLDMEGEAAAILALDRKLHPESTGGAPSPSASPASLVTAPGCAGAPVAGAPKGGGAALHVPSPIDRDAWLAAHPDSNLARERAGEPGPLMGGFSGVPHLGERSTPESRVRALMEGRGFGPSLVRQVINVLAHPRGDLADWSETIAPAFAREIEAEWRGEHKS